MNVHALLLLLVSTVVVAAQQAESVAGGDPLVPNHQHVGQYKEFDTVVAKAAETGRSTRNMGLNMPSHRIILIAVSSKNTPPVEVHLGETDCWVIVGGAGYVLLGGDVVNPRYSLSPAGGKQIVGTAITGGTKYPAKAGDIFNIPTGLAHQALLDPGQSMTYYNIKIKDAPETVPTGAKATPYATSRGIEMPGGGGAARGR